MSEETKTKAPAKRRGRPPKSEVKKKRPVGRPKGEAAIMKEYRERLLASPKSRKVLDSILNAALDDEHKNQAAAWKLLVDRLMPLSYFEKEKNGTGGAAVNITISGLDGSTVNIGGSDDQVVEEEPIEEAEYEVINEDDD